MTHANQMHSYKIHTFGEPLKEYFDPIPVPKGSEVVLRVGACGICHSDLHVADGHFDLGGGQKLDLKTMRLPRIPGHEIAGTVVAVGPDVRNVRIGDRCIAFPWIGCGDCGVCASGNEHLCARPRSLGLSIDGGFADHVLVPHERYLVDFEGIPEPLAATFACSGLTAYSALKKLKPLAAGDSLLIIGAGGVGLAAVRLAQPVLGVAPYVADLDQSKWDAAKQGGACETMDPTNADARKDLMKRTGGFAAVVDFVGAAATAEFGMGMLRKGGRMITVGLFGGSMNLSTAMLPLRAISLIGSYVGSLEELKELVAMAKSGVQLGLPVTPRPLATAQQSLDDLRGGRVVGRVVLTP